MPNTQTITHAEEVKRAVRWAYEDWDALYVLEEHQLPAWLREDKHKDRNGRKRRESPDVFAVLRSGNTLVIEVKVDEKDERRDHEKDHREYGMGDIRVKLCPPYIIEPHEVTVQSGWQLYWHHPDSDQIECKVELEDAIYIQNVNVRRERLMLAHAKLQERSGKGKSGAGQQAPGNIPQSKWTEARHWLQEHGFTSRAYSATAQEVGDEVLADWRTEIRMGTRRNWLASEAIAGRGPGIQAERIWGKTCMWAKEGGDE